MGPVRSAVSRVAGALLVCLLAPLPAHGDLESLLLKREAEVRGLALRTKELFHNRCNLTVDCGCSYNSCFSALPNATCGTVQTDRCSLGRLKMDMHSSSVRLVQGTDVKDEALRESVCFSRSLDSGPFKEFAETTMAEEPESLQQMMFGSFTGSYRIFPGRGDASCLNYDPRIRPWYVAASSGPKDVLLVLDISGSMRNAGRLDTLKLAVDAVLDTLTLADYFNVVTFHSEATRMMGEEAELVWASAENIELAKGVVQGLKASAQTNFYAAFETAYEILNRPQAEHTSNCQRVMLFMTDGHHTDTRHTLQEVEDLVAAEHKKGPTPIFSYSLGPGAGVDMPRRVSCMTGGVHAAIPDGKHYLRDAMTHYYHFAALGSYHTYQDPSSPSAKPVWVEPYEFASPPDTMGTTVALPIYDDSTQTLIGVAAIDVTVASLVRAAGSSGQLLESLRTRSSVCSMPAFSECQLERMRLAKGDIHNTCDTCPANASSSLSLDPQPCNSTLALSTLWCNPRGPSDECCGEPVDPDSSSSSSGIEETSTGMDLLLILSVCGFILLTFCMFTSSKRFRRWLGLKPHESPEVVEDDEGSKGEEKKPKPKPGGKRARPTMAADGTEAEDTDDWEDEDYWGGDTEAGGDSGDYDRYTYTDGHGMGEGEE